MHLYKLAQAHFTEPITIVDVGTGSGAIAVTLALLFPEAKVYATDISKQALDMAKQNAKTHHAPVTFLHGDYLQPLISKNIKTHMLVSNPPYIDWSETHLMSRTVKNFDPELALFAGEEGLAAYRRIIEQAPHVLNEKGFIAFEIGYQQADDVCSL